ncbi:hypothetical protein DFH11DRAFT_1729368 [Phellopilus nigrolimitatus]|nr:hypothetical protein DFH11DRAFT_1729368 [Phellopilus nigrolimitatus]
MSSPAARAEARRKAILSRGSDRLSKLTSSARGEDHPAYMNTDSLAQKAPTTETFLGEETIMPTPPARASPAPNPNSNQANPSAWSAEQQQEFLRALMAAPELTGAPPNPSLNARRAFQAEADPQIGPGAEADAGGGNEDPMAAMLSALTQLTGGQAPPALNFGGMPGMPPMPMGPQTTAATTPAPRRTLLQRLRPVLHLLATWILLAYFALFQEPDAYELRVARVGTEKWGMFQRWAELGWRRVEEERSACRQLCPFFWAFTTLQLILHSIQIFTKSNPVQPPMLLALALPHLPPLASSFILNALGYLRMGGMLLDDVAGLIVGVGFLVWVAGWAVGEQ